MNDSTATVKKILATAAKIEQAIRDLDGQKALRAHPESMTPPQIAALQKALISSGEAATALADAVRAIAEALEHEQEHVRRLSLSHSPAQSPD